MAIGSKHPTTTAFSLDVETTIAEQLRKHRGVLLLAAVSYVVLFWPALVELASFWNEDPDFSHGFLIPVICGVILWSNREKTGKIKSKASTLGLLAVGFFIAIYFVGYMMRTNIIQRCGLWGTLVTSCWAAFGMTVLRKNPFPFFYLLLAIPPHYALHDQIRLSLKTYATLVSADALKLFNIEALPQTNILIVGERRLEVADACSGIRSLMAIIATALLFSYLFRTGILKGSLLVLTAVPVTILVNVLRIVIVAVCLIHFDFDLTSGWKHEALGMLVFSLSIAALYGSWIFYSWLFKWKPTEEVE